MRKLAEVMCSDCSVLGCCYKLQSAATGISVSGAPNAKTFVYLCLPPSVDAAQFVCVTFLAGINGSGRLVEEV